VSTGLSEIVFYLERKENTSFYADFGGCRNICDFFLILSITQAMREADNRSESLMINSGLCNCGFFIILL
jgi:hypothetical protein